MTTQAVEAPPQRFVSQVTVVDGDTPYNSEDKVGALVQAAAANTWTLIWERTIPAQRIYRVGSGSPQYPVCLLYTSPSPRD